MMSNMKILSGICWKGFLRIYKKILGRDNMIIVKQNNGENLKKYVLDGLVENNKQKCKWFEENPSSDG